MKISKKFLSILLSAVMVISMAVSGGMSANAVNYNETFNANDAKVGQSYECSLDLMHCPDSGESYKLNSIESVQYNYNCGLEVTSSGNKLIVSGTPTEAFSGTLCTVTCKTGALGTNTLYVTVKISITGTANSDGIVWKDAEQRYEISDYAGLKTFAAIVNGVENPDNLTDPQSANAILTADIVATGYNDWTPIGMDNNHIYIGTFDGNGRVIIGLSNSGVTDAPIFAGLFGYVGAKTEGGVTTKGTVKNVGLVGGSITGKNKTGGVVGHNNGLITGCYFKGAVSGSDYCGGIVGINYGAVENCYNTGDVNGAQFVGGVVGFIANGSLVSNCYNTGSVTATGDYVYVGGVIGWNSNEGEVTNCYNTGSVTATGDYVFVGGVAGYNNGTLINCYYDSSVATGIPAIGRGSGTSVKGLTTAQMTGEDALSDSNMKFVYSSPEKNPWLSKADGADEDSRKYYWFYPHLTGFAYDTEFTVENWPAKTEVIVTLSEYSYGYDGTPHMPTVTSVIIGGKTLGPDTDYTVSYYKSGTPAESPVNAGNYKAVVTFTDTGYAKGHTPIEKEFKITPRAVTVTAASEEFTYDGTAHSNNNYEVDGLVGSDAITAVVTGSITYSSESPVPNVLESYEFTSGSPDNYNVKTVNGELSIAARNVTVTITGKQNSAPYDGREHIVSDYRAESSDPLYKCSGETLDFNFTGTAKASRTDVGKTDMGLTDSQFVNKNENFDVTFDVTDGYQEIVAPKVTVTVKGNSAEADYDGSEHIASGYTATADNEHYDVENDFEFNGTSEAKRTEPGTESMGLEAGQFRNTNTNFDVTFEVEEDGKLTVNPVIKFVNEDGKELQSSAVALGTTPGYTGETPQKEKDEWFTYEFDKWTPDIAAANDNAIYTASFTPVPIEYTATFVDENGNVIGEATYTVNTEKLDEPEVPEKTNYTGEWEEYTLGANDITIKPVYTLAGETVVNTDTESEITLGYKESKRFAFEPEFTPDGATAHVFYNGEDRGEGTSIEVKEPTDDYTVECKVLDKDGNEIATSGEIKVKVKNSFFDRLKWFFNNFWANILKTFIDALIAAC